MGLLCRCCFMFSNIILEYKKLGFFLGFKIFIIIVLGLEIVFGICVSCIVLLIYWNKRSVWSVVMKFIVNFVFIDFIICCVCVLFIIVCVLGFVYFILFCCWYEVVIFVLRNVLFIILLFICYDCYKLVMNLFVLRFIYFKVRCVVILVWCLSIVSFIVFFFEWWWKVKILWFFVCILMFSELKEFCFFCLYYLLFFLLLCIILFFVYLWILKVVFFRVYI